MNLDPLSGFCQFNTTLEGVIETSQAVARPFIDANRFKELRAAISEAGHDALHSPEECVGIGYEVLQWLHHKLDGLKQDLQGQLNPTNSTQVNKTIDNLETDLKNPLQNAFWACKRFAASAIAPYKDLMDFLQTGEIKSKAQTENLTYFFKDFSNKWAWRFGLANDAMRFEFSEKDIPEYFKFDWNKLERILDNLVRNAMNAMYNQIEEPTIKTQDAVLKFNAQVIDSKLGLRELIISISNPGTIPQRIRERIFERGISSSAEAERGLGLYNVKTLTEALGGRVELNESDGQVKFTVTIPEATS